MKYFLTFLVLLTCLLLFQCRKDNHEGPDKNAPSTPHTGPAPGGGQTIVIPYPGLNADIQPSVQAAVDAAANGDLILLPEGSFPVRKSIIVHKFISFRGAGAAKTVLYRPENLPDIAFASDSLNCIFKFIINSALPSHIVVSDLCLKSKRPCINTGDGGSLAADVGIKFISCIDFVVTRCRFENFGDAGVCVQHDDNLARGLICKNQFSHNVKGPDGLGLGYGVEVIGANKQWVTDPQFGSPNFIFVEDNFFDFHRHAIAAGGCGLYVFRYNTITNNNIGVNSGQAIDAHEARLVPGLNYYSTRAVEIYNNLVINTTFKDGTPIVPGGSSKSLVENAILIRGGEALIHDNVIEGYRFAIGIMNFIVQGPQSYPILSQIGYESGLMYGAGHSGINFNHGAGDLFAWNNQFSPYTGADSSGLFYNYQPQYFEADRDFHLVSKPGYAPYVYPHPGFSF